MVKLREEFHKHTDNSIDPEIWFKHVADNRNAQQVQELKQAYEFAEVSGHETPTLTGIPCSQFGLSMADILDNLHMDVDSMIAAMIYPTYVYGELTEEDITEHLGKKIAKLVTGIKQMDAIRSLYDEAHQQHHSQTQIDNIRKMLLAMAQDVRVVLIKLAERTVLMRTSGLLSDLQKQKLAKETQDLYAPLANRLGIAQIKWELEDFAFRYLQPEIYKKIAKSVALKRVEREEYIKTVMDTLQSYISAEGITDFEVTGRAKHIYSIYRKMQRKNVDFSQIYDASAVRVLVPTIADCYTVLGIAHSVWEPIAEEFDDYINNPKPNGYRSLHTAVIGPGDCNVEIQIRTNDMHHESELGVAAHWIYKEGGGKRSAYDQKIAWLRQIIDWQKEVTHVEKEGIEENPQFEDRVYVFTPTGEIIDLPIGATPLDFAYNIHTEIGHRCRGAKINGSIVPLTYRLQMGDRIEILTAKEANPSRDWMNPNLGYLKSSRAKAKIHHWFKIKNHDKNMHLGHEMLDRELKKLHVHQYDLAAVMARFNHTSEEEFFAALGAGGLRIGQILTVVENQLREKEKHEKAETQPEFIAPLSTPSKKHLSSSAINIHGIGNLLYNIATCCKPIPGDAIIGFITHGRGVSIHRQDCSNILLANHEQKQRLIEVNWGEKVGSYPVDIYVHAYDRHGLVRDITTLLANEKINIVALNTTTNKKENTATIVFTVETPDLSGLSRIMDRISQLPNIIKVERQQG